MLKYLGKKARGSNVYNKFNKTYFKALFTLKGLNVFKARFTLEGLYVFKAPFTLEGLAEKVIKFNCLKC